MTADPQSFQGALSEQEQARLTELTEDPNAVGYAVFTLDAEEIDGVGLADDAVPVCANLIDIADRFATDLGEGAGCLGVTLEGSSVTYRLEPLGDPWLVVHRRKGGGK
ncbi:MAG: hypothetical protein AAF913_10455 [Pseudomonadota bacterium]